VIRAKQSLDLITIGSVIFFSVGQNKSGRFITSDDIFPWKFLFWSYFQDVVSVISKYSIHTDVVRRQFWTLAGYVLAQKLILEHF